MTKILDSQKYCSKYLKLNDFLQNPTCCVRAEREVFLVVEANHNDQEDQEKTICWYLGAYPIVCCPFCGQKLPEELEKVETALEVVHYPDEDFYAVPNKTVYTLLEGILVYGTHAAIKKRLLAHGTIQAIEDASLLPSPLVTVRIGKETFTRDVTSAHKYISSLPEGYILPEEIDLLRYQSPPCSICPHCASPMYAGGTGKPGTPLMRGVVQRSKTPWYAPWKTRPYCAVICPKCKEIIGWEEPNTGQEKATGPYR